jgi:transcriptional regulator GlxA family with amidase domain
LVAFTMACMIPYVELPQVEVLLFPGFDELDAVGPWEVLAAAGFSVTPVGWPDDGGWVEGGHHLRVAVTRSLGQPGLLVVPGGGWLAGTGVRALVLEGSLPRRLRQLHEDGAVLASVCTGAVLLAEAGLLRGRPAVTNALALDAIAERGAVVRAEARVVDDGEVVTSGGPLAGVDLAIRLVERYLGETAAVAAAARLEHERRGPLLLGGALAS